MSATQIIQALAQMDIHAERKSIYSDLDALRRAGVDIQYRKGHTSGWFLRTRDIPLPEVKLLMDAVQVSHLVPQDRRDALLHQLEGLTSVHQARQLRQRPIWVSGRLPGAEAEVPTYLDRLHTALAAQRPVTFQYFDYDLSHRRSFRRGGGRYTVSPCGLIWSNERCYLVGFDHARRQMRHYRVDKMADLVVTSLHQEGQDLHPPIPLDQYAKRHFGMYAGPEATVTLRGSSSMAEVVWDRFGSDAPLVPDGADHFTVTLPVALSPQFFGWLFGLEGELVLTAPREAVETYRRRLAAALREADRNDPCVRRSAVLQ